MSLWKEGEHKEVPTTEWFASLLERSGFKPEKTWTNGPTHFAHAGGFVFSLGKEHIEAAGSVASGVRVALMKRNAQKLTDLYEDGLSVVFKSPDAITAFSELLDKGDALTDSLRQRMNRAFARQEQGTRREHPTTARQNEDTYLAPAGGIA